MRRSLMLAVAATVVATGGCLDFLRQTKTSPSPTAQSFSGTWSSVAPATSSATGCGSFTWQVTEVSGNTVSGSFSATCAGSLQVTGTATGTLTTQGLAWSASGVATAPNGLACPVTLAGTATLEGNQIRVVYSGTTCLGPVSGTEILTRS